MQYIKPKSMRYEKVVQAVLGVPTSKVYQDTLNQPYSCSEGAFPLFLFSCFSCSCSISRFAVANSSSDGIFTIMRYITFYKIDQSVFE